jgi:hypothetical protein
LAISGLIGNGRQNCLPALFVLLGLLCCANTIGAAIFTLLIGEARQIKKFAKIFIIGVASAPLCL